MKEEQTLMSDAEEPTEVTEETPQDEESNVAPEEQNSDAGQKNVKGQEESLTLEELEGDAGRNFKSIDDFKKHYKELTSYVGKKKTDSEPKPQVGQIDQLKELNEKIESIEEKTNERDFVEMFPDAEKYLDIVRSVAAADGSTLSSTWKTKFSKIINGYEAHLQDTGIGVTPKNRLTPTESKENQQLRDDAKAGIDAAQEALVGKHLKDSGIL